MTHISKILAKDSGFNSPWNAPRLLRAKNAFLMFSAIERLAERLCCHHPPRHLAEIDVGTQESICTDLGTWDWVDILTISSLDALSFRHESTVKSLMISACEAVDSIDHRSSA